MNLTGNNYITSFCYAFQLRHEEISLLRGYYKRYYIRPRSGSWLPHVWLFHIRFRGSFNMSTIMRKLQIHSKARHREITLLFAIQPRYVFSRFAGSSVLRIYIRNIPITANTSAYRAWRFGEYQTSPTTSSAQRSLRRYRYTVSSWLLLYTRCRRNATTNAPTPFLHPSLKLDCGFFFN